MDGDFVPNEPTADQCSRHEKVCETEYDIGYAMWYPSMGGYVGKSVVMVPKGDDETCIEVFVWHDGDFPFRSVDSLGDEASPRRLHHCCPEQFVHFGEAVMGLFSKSPA